MIQGVNLLSKSFAMNSENSLDSNELLAAVRSHFDNTKHYELLDYVPDIDDKNI